MGIGSWLFHMTLKYEFQLLDELPMIYTTIIMVWAMWSHGVSKTSAVVLAVVLAAFGIAVTVIYLSIKDPLFHQVAYAFLTGLVLTRSCYLMLVHVPDQKVRKDMYWVISIGVLTFLAGFVCWIIDNEYCSEVTRIRRRIGLPWGMLLEGHGYWHLLTAIGVYFYIVYLEYLRIYLTNRQSEYKLVWTGNWFAHVDKRNAAVANGKKAKKIQ